MGLALLALVCASDASAMAQRTFATPDEAVQALITALEQNDVAALTLLLGENSEEAVTSGDEVADANDRSAFVASFKSKHQLVAEGRDKMILVVGESDWPLPIPLVAENGKWYLDGAAGAKEIVYRRIGRNELGAIAVCRGFIDAQLEYAALGHDGQPAGLFAAKLRSDPGQHNGLYWPVGEGEPASRPERRSSVPRPRATGPWSVNAPPIMATTTVSCMLREPLPMGGRKSTLSKGS